MRSPGLGSDLTVYDEASFASKKFRNRKVPRLPRGWDGGLKARLFFGHGVI